MRNSSLSLRLCHPAATAARMKPQPGQKNIDGPRITPATKTPAPSRQTTDSLTGLPNRRGPSALLEKRSRLLPGKAAVICLADIDGFKAIKNTQGHLWATCFFARSSAGRCSVALGRIRSCPRASTGDEFRGVFSRWPAARASRLLAGHCMRRQLGLGRAGGEGPFSR